ncbi:hypothetical protein ACFL2H_02655 [Planctomycetota bacterium]
MKRNKHKQTFSLAIRDFAGTQLEHLSDRAYGSHRVVQLCFDVQHRCAETSQDRLLSTPHRQNANCVPLLAV